MAHYTYIPKVLKHVHSMSDHAALHRFYIFIFNITLRAYLKYLQYLEVSTPSKTGDI
jgi:hypothetical protein